MTEDGTWDAPKGHTVFVPHGHAALIYPLPAISDSTDDDGAAIIDHLGSAAKYVNDLIDNGEQKESRVAQCPHG